MILMLNEVHGVGGGGSFISLRNERFLRSYASRNSRRFISVRQKSQEWTAIDKVLFAFLRLDLASLKTVFDILGDIDYSRTTIWLDTSKFGILALLLKLCFFGKNLKLVFYFHNDEVTYYRAQSEHHDRNAVAKKAKGFLIFLQQKLTLSLSDQSFFISDEERGDLDRSGHWLPPTWPRPAQATMQARRKIKRCIMVGSNFHANREAFDWLKVHIAPSIRVPLLFVGRHLSQSYHSEGNIQVVSDPADIDVFYTPDTLVLVPNEVGAGLKVKLAEALQHKCITLATPFSAKGFRNLRAYEESGLLFIRGRGAFLETCVELYSREHAVKDPGETFTDQIYFRRLKDRLDRLK